MQEEEEGLDKAFVCVHVCTASAARDWYGRAAGVFDEAMETG